MDFPKPEIGWGGRTDRDDPDDEEPVVYIPVSAFTELKKK